MGCALLQYLAWIPVPTVKRDIVTFEGTPLSQPEHEVSQSNSFPLYIYIKQVPFQFFSRPPLKARKRKDYFECPAARNRGSPRNIKGVPTPLRC